MNLLLEKRIIKKFKINLCFFESGVLNSSAVKPEPYFIMNGGSLKIKTSSINLGRNWNGCAPEGIEAKADIIINEGNIVIESSDDAINAGASVTINGGTVIGFGSSNITYPADTSKQNVVVLGTSGFSGKRLEIIQNGKTNISCDLSDVDRSEVLIFSSENLSKGDFSVSLDGRMWQQEKLRILLLR